MPLIHCYSKVVCLPVKYFIESNTEERKLYVSFFRIFEHSTKTLTTAVGFGKTNNVHISYRDFCERIRAQLCIPMNNMKSFSHTINFAKLWSS